MKKLLLSIMFPMILLTLSHLAAAQAAPPSQNDQLIAAAGNGDVAAVEQLLAEGANIDAKNTGGYTPLILAALRDKSDVVKLLLDKGASVEAPEKTVIQRSSWRPSRARPRW